MDVIRPPGIAMIAPRVSAGLHRDEFVVALLVGEGAARSGEIRIERRRVLIDIVHVAAAGIGLPDFHQRLRHRPLVLVEHAAVHDDALAQGLALVLLGEIIVGLLDRVMAEGRTRELRQRVRHDDQRFRRRALHRALVFRRQMLGINAEAFLGIDPKESLGVYPKHLSPEYKSTVKRSPSKPLIIVPHTLSELTGPAFGHDAIQETDNDLTKQHKGEPLGERIIVHGRVLDEDKRPVPETLVEIWQANACGRYVHNVDQHPAPLDPNFTGAGRTLTDKDGYYKFITVKPGAYPWGNHRNAWRPNHIHFSVFGQSFLTRLVTQMYFPGDPLFPFDPIFNSVTDEKARHRMISSFDLENTVPDWALCFRFDIVLRGREQTPTHTEKH